MRPTATVAMMASEISYTITVSNNRTEKAAIDYLLEKDARFWAPNPTARKAILAEMGVSPALARAFDLLIVEDPIVGESGFATANVNSITLVELKTTRKRLPTLPDGFFFGATQNEFDLAAQLGDRYRFCFVSLHPESMGYCLLTLAELEPRIRTKRTQYQINL